MKFTPEHDEIRRNISKFIASDINPFVDEWEKAGIFPAHELFGKMGKLGFLGINKPVEFGGSGLDYSYAMAFAEELGQINCGGVPMAIGVQTDSHASAMMKCARSFSRRRYRANMSPASACPKSAPAPTSPR